MKLKRLPLPFVAALLILCFGLTACGTSFYWFIMALLGISPDGLASQNQLTPLQTNSIQINAGESTELFFSVNLGCFDLRQEAIACENTAQLNMQGERLGASFASIPNGISYQLSTSELSFSSLEEQTASVRISVAEGVKDGFYTLSLLAKESSNDMIQEIPIQVQVGSGGSSGEYRLDVSRDGEGKLISDDGKIDCFDYSAASKCNSTYPAGTSIVLSAIPANKFERWSGCSENGGGEDGNQCFLSINQDTVVFAQFFSSPEQP